MMEKLADLAAEKGVRDKLLLIAGGTQVTDELAREWGMDAGFGRRTKGIDVASFIVKTLRSARAMMPAMPAPRRIDALVAEIGSTTTVVSAFDGLAGWPDSEPRAPRPGRRADLGRCRATSASGCRRRARRARGGDRSARARA